MILFDKKNEVTDVAMNILKKRYFHPGESTWEDVANRVVDYVLEGVGDEQKELTREMITNRYFIPNSPCLVNSGKHNGGLLACFVLPLEDTIEDIYKTKLDFALIARKGGGSGTTLSNLRPKNSVVADSAHGYSGGPIGFFDTICHDMEVITQAGFRKMAMMGTMSVYHPDIMMFISAKEQEGIMTTTNISVVVDNAFMEKVKNNEEFQTYFDYKDGRKYFDTYKARDIFNLIVEGAWRNGEPGLLFYDAINDSPYKYSGVKIEATNPCGEQPLPPYGSCNLGSIDLSKLLKEDLSINMEQFETAIRLGTRFLDKVIDVNSFPTKEIEETAKRFRPTGLGVMGLADYYLKRRIAYGTKQALEELSFILGFMKNIAEDESIRLGEEFGVPEGCKNLPIPRRNVTVLTIAPTGTISLIANCNSGIEPIFSEITYRSDKTGDYTFNHELSEEEYFRCAVSSNGCREVTWEEHVDTQAVSQRFIDSGVSKTINFPNHTHRETIAKAFMKAWESNCKGITVYRNGSRELEVLSPKNLKKDKCPLCESEIIKYDGCKKCSKCEWSICSV